MMGPYTHYCFFNLYRYIKKGITEILTIDVVWVGAFVAETKILTKIFFQTTEVHNGFRIC